MDRHRLEQVSSAPKPPRSRLGKVANDGFLALVLATSVSACGGKEVGAPSPNHGLASGTASGSAYGAAGDSGSAGVPDALSGTDAMASGGGPQAVAVNSSSGVPAPPPGTDSGPPGPRPAGEPCLQGSDCHTGGATTCRGVGAAGGDSSRNGYCTRSCDPSIGCGNGEICAAVGQENLCLSLCPAAPGWCGDGSRCKELPNGGGSVCYPQCGSDKDCAAGRCDLNSGLCSSSVAPHGSYPVGSPCSPTAAENPCAGVCANLQGSGMCTSPCNQGFYEICPVCLNVGGAFQTGAPGNCFQPCNCNRDCFQADAICDPFTGREDVGRTLFSFTRGVCVARSAFPNSPGLPTCLP